MGRNKNKDEFAKYLKKRIRECNRPSGACAFALHASAARSGAYKDALEVYQKFLTDGTLNENK